MGKYMKKFGGRKIVLMLLSLVVAMVVNHPSMGYSPQAIESIMTNLTIVVPVTIGGLAVKDGLIGKKKGGK